MTGEIVKPSLHQVSWVREMGTCLKKSYSEAWRKFFIFFFFLLFYFFVFMRNFSEKNYCRNFPGNAVAEISSSNAGDVGSTPGQGAGIPYAPWPRNQNINNMDLESVIQSEVSQKEKNRYHTINAYIWNLEKWYRRTCLQCRNIDVENGHVDMGVGGVMNWQSSTDIYTLSCVK